MELSARNQLKGVVRSVTLWWNTLIVRVLVVAEPRGVDR
jgi:molybdopterin-binding protein